jgi:hypothetical protein
MSLRSGAVHEEARLSDGRLVRVRVGLAEDPYVAPRELDTVVAELRDEQGHVLGVVSTVLDAADDGPARRLARAIAHKLEAGEIEPTAGDIEPLADEIP